MVVSQLGVSQSRTFRNKIPVIVDISSTLDPTQHFLGYDGVVDVAACFATSKISEQGKRKGKSGRFNKYICKNVNMFIMMVANEFIYLLLFIYLFTTIV